MAEGQGGRGGGVSHRPGRLDRAYPMRWPTGFAGFVSPQSGAVVGVAGGGRPARLRAVLPPIRQDGGLFLLPRTGRLTTKKG